MRRLMAVIALDIVGYSRMMAQDEEGTLNAWRDLRRRLNSIFEDHACRVVKSTGDGLLVEASSVIEGTRAAIEVQNEVDAWNRARTEGPEFKLRIGVNLGDVIVEEDGDIYGDGVNVAARLEALADAGGICLSDAAYQQVKGRLDTRFEDRGEQWVKNIPTPVRVWAVASGPIPTGDELNLGIAGIGQAVAVGRGGNATVYRAHQASMDRTVAIKVLDSSDAATRRRFDRERQAMGRLSQHSGIITIYDSGYTSSGRPYLVMPYFEDGSLQDRLEEGGAMPWEEAVNAVAAVADAVDHAHQQGIIHRDLKPSNIMVDSQGRPHVADFGIALLADWSQTYTEQLVLTPAYSAPELLDGVEPTVASDVYALGASLAALIMGSPPFMTGSPDRDGLLALSRRISEEPPPDLTEFDVPKDVNAVIQRAMAKDPADRPESAARFAAELTGTESAAITTQPRTTRQPTRPTPAVPPQKLIDRVPGGWISLGGALAAVIAVIVGISLLGGPGDSGTDGVGDTGDTGVTTSTEQPTTTSEPAVADDGGGTAPGAVWGPIALPDRVTHVVAGGDTVLVATANGELRAYDPSSGAERWVDTEEVGTMVADDSWAYILGPSGSLVKRFSHANPADSSSKILQEACVNKDPKMVIADSVLYVTLGCIPVEAFDTSDFSVAWVNPTAANTDISAIASDGDPTRAGEEMTAVAGFQTIWLLDSEGARRAIRSLAQVDCGASGCTRVPWLGVVVEPLGGGAFDTTVVAQFNEELGQQLESFRDEVWVGPIDVDGVPVVEAETIYVGDLNGELAAFDLDLLPLATWENPGISADWPVIVDGRLLYAVDGDTLYTLNSRSGRIDGEVQLPARPTRAPVLANGLIVFGAGNELYAVEPPG